MMPSVTYSLLKNKIVQFVIVGGVCGVGGAWFGYSNRPEPEVRYEEKFVEKTVVDQTAIQIAVEKAQQEWKKLQKTKTVTRVVTKPSGEKVEETVTEVETLESQESNTEQQQEQTVVKKEETAVQVEINASTNPYTPQWSIASSVYKNAPDLFSTLPQEKLDYEVTVGRKVIWDVWVETSYRFKSNEVGIGVRYEF